MNTTQQGVPPAWYVIILGLAGAVLMVADQMVRPLLPWWAWPPVAIAAGALTVVITFVQMNSRADGPVWLRIFLYRGLVWVGLGAMTTLVDFHGWTWTLGLWWVGGTIAIAAFGTVCPLPPVVEREEPQFTGRDRRPEYVQAWEGHIRDVTGWKTTRVVNWERWENPDEGFRLRVELPVDTGQTEVDLAGFCTKLGGAARLLTGCHVQVLPSDVQGVAVLDVMEVDNLSKTDNLVHVEPTTPASLNDSFTVMTSPRGEPLDVCLRIETATIGGATGSGKTTLMNRIIMFLARCTDTLIWVADYNGGGLANNWVEPWARGRCERPVVDWVATDENEFALMTAVARAISTARKQSPEVRRRIRATRSGGVLPIGADLPAIVVLADEGGSIQQKLSALGAIAAEGLDQLAQLGRAMAVRPMVSVLRGTSDLMSKGFRTQSSIRLCLRMNEHGEYIHVLDVTPPKTPLKHKGAGYLRTMELDQPVYGRTVNVDEDAIERHAIACSQLRPLLDQYAQDVAARVRPADVTGGDKEYPGWIGSMAYLHAMDGKAYSGRWERAALLLAELRDEELPEQPAAAPVVGAALPSTSTPALDAWASAMAPAATVPTQADGDARIYQFPGAQPAAPQARPASDGGSTTARGQIIEALHRAGAQGLSATELEKAIGATKTRMYQVLPELKDQKAVAQSADGRYFLAEYAVSAG